MPVRRSISVINLGTRLKRAAHKAEPPPGNILARDYLSQVIYHWMICHGRYCTYFSKIGIEFFRNASLNRNCWTINHPYWKAAFYPSGIQCCCFKSSGLFQKWPPFPIRYIHCFHPATRVPDFGVIVISNGLINSDIPYSYFSVTSTLCDKWKDPPLPRSGIFPFHVNRLFPAAPVMCCPHNIFFPALSIWMTFKDESFAKISFLRIPHDCSCWHSPWRTVNPLPWSTAEKCEMICHQLFPWSSNLFFPVRVNTFSHKFKICSQDKITFYFIK